MELSLEAKEAIRGAVEDMVKQFPDILGIDEIIPGCQVFSLDPFGVGVGVLPRYLEVGLRGTAPAVGSGTGYRVHVLFRGGLTLVVGDYVTVVHMRDADRYEVLTAGGSAGTVVAGAPADAQYLVLALNATLTNERRLDPLAWLGAADGGAGADYDLSFYPDLPIVVGTGAIPLEYATIQAAITAAAAGQTVLIPPGTYAEDITLKSGVLVVGWGAREDIRITGDESVVTTASGGHLENVTVDADAPDGGAYRGAVLFNSAGICTFRGVRIEMTSNANTTGACGIHTTGANAGTLNIHDVEIIVSTNQDNSMACGIRITGTYNLYLADFLIEAVNTGVGSGGYGTCAIGIMGTDTGTRETRHGKIMVAGDSTYSLYNFGAGVLSVYSVIASRPVYGVVNAMKFETTGIRQTAGQEIFPDTDGRGLFVRAVNRLGIATYINHFRSVANGGLGNVIPTGFTWRGAPFGGTPAALNYNRLDDFFAVTADGAGTRHFLADDVANAAASWQNKSICGRIRTGAITEVGFRLDDGTDNNYAEIYVTGVLANATQRLDYRHRVGGGAVTTVASGLIIPCDTFVTVRLLCYWSGAAYLVNGYLVPEDGDTVNITGFSTGAVVWMPAAGRVGFMVKEAGNYGMYDWFYHTFGLA